MLSDSKIQNAYIGFDTRFNVALDALRKDGTLVDIPMVKGLAIEVPSSTKVEQYNWLGALPKFQEWKDTRSIAQMRAEKMTITNLRFANGIEIDLDDIEDDRFGMYPPKIDSLAFMAMVHRIDSLVDYLVQGFATTTYGTAYDGQAFFSTAHVEGDGANQSNKITPALGNAGALDLAIQTMAQIKDENGTPYYVRPTHLIHGPTTRGAANDALKQYLTGGASNPNYNIVTDYMTPRITDNKWFLADLSKPFKPLIFQLRRDVRSERAGFAETEMTVERFKTNKAYFGASARYAFGYGAWQTIVGSDAST